MIFTILGTIILQTKKPRRRMNCMEQKLEMVRKAVKMAGMENEVEVNEELVYSIFGENLEVENTVEEIAEMFMFEL